MRRLAFAFALLCAAAAHGVMRLGPEVELIPAQQLISPTGSRGAAVASNGRSFLALWNDFSRTYALRIDGDGTIREALPRPLPHVKPGAFVASDGTDYLILWSEGGTLFTQRVDEDAQPLGLVHKLVALIPEIFVSNGSTYLVTERYGFGPALILDRDGRLLHKIEHDAARNTAFAGITRNGDYQLLERSIVSLQLLLRTIRSDGTTSVQTLSDSLGIQYTDGISVAVTAERMLVAWISQTQAGCWMAIFDREGNLLRAPQQIFPGTYRAVRVASDGREFLVMTRTRALRSEFLRISQSGDVLDTAPLLFSTNAPYLPSFAVSASTRLFVWEDPRFGRTLILGRSFTDLAALAAKPDSAEILSYGQAHPNDVQMARSAEHELVAIADDEEAIHAFVDGRRVPIPFHRVFPRSLAVAAGPGSFLLSWRERFDGLRAVAMRIGFDGRALDPQPVVLGPPPNIGSERQARQAIAVNATEFAVATPYDRYVNVTHIGHDGAIVKAEQVEFSNVNSNVDALRLLWNGSRFVVVYSISAYNGRKALDIVRLDDAPFRTGAYQPNPPALAAAAGERITLVWPGDFQYEIVQTALDGVHVYTWRYSGIQYRQGRVEPELLWTGTEYVLAWWEYGSPPKIRAVRLDASANTLNDGPFDVGVADFQSSTPSIVRTPDGVRIAYIRDSQVFARTLERVERPQIRRR